ncbi:hypothetical protein [Nesterenkonia xinjiangensis]|uniref:Uncharacterized protein n=1 Tax=Nesterenkonia xinjiangensis TaxID=225327 RepID=A0A7Z0GKD4_9MICC|nr:hypothetical protein [Nesterenkonia xinjiangensis]NYJ77333.1 hypothetical protein [Nesterenkonia xinjiangensis]
MDSPDNSPQIGSVDVERDALNKGGAQLAQLIEDLGFKLDTESASGAPTDGWRVLRRHAGRATLLGTPISSEGDSWRLATVQLDTGAGIVRVHPETARLRPSRADRRRPLELRWPALMETGSDLEDFAIDIVNVGSTRWLPNDDTFYVIGIFTKPGVTSFDYGVVSSGSSKAVPLDPQEYARVPIHIDPKTWADLEPGNYDLHTVLIGLNLHGTVPLRVSVSAEIIARHVARAPRPRRTVAERRRSVESQIDQLRSLISAGASLAPLAQAVSSSATEEDALVRIRDLLVCDEQTAQTIYGSSLRELRPGNAATLQQQIDELARHLDKT